MANNSEEGLKIPIEVDLAGIEASIKKVGDTFKNTFKKPAEDTNKEFDNLKNKTKSNFNAIASTIKNSVSKITGYLTTLQTKLKAVGTTMSSVGKTMMLGITTPVVAGFSVMIKASTDYAESINKIEVVFENQAEAIKKWSNTTIQNFGIAGDSALEMASLFGDMGKSMGLTIEEASEMSMSLVGLAGDLSSFKNVSLDIAQTALKGIFTGEGESLKNLGIVMTDTTLSAYALEKGITKKYSAMSQAEKVALRYQYVMEMTKDAQGDFARTSDGAANQMRMFGEIIKEIGRGLGDILLPGFTKIITKVNNALLKFNSLSTTSKKVILAIAGISASIGPLLFIGGKLVTLFASLGTVILNGLLPLTLISGLALGVYKAVDKNLFGLGDLFEKFKKSLKKKIDTIKDFFSDFENKYKTFSESFKKYTEEGIDRTQAFTKALVDGFGDNKITGTINTIIIFIDKLIKKIDNAIDKANEVYKETGKITEGIKTAISELFGENLFTNAINSIITFFDDLVTTIKDLASKIDFKKVITDIFSPIVDFFSEFGEPIQRVYENVIEPICTAIVVAFGSVGLAIVENSEKIGNVIELYLEPFGTLLNDVIIPALGWLAEVLETISPLIYPVAEAVLNLGLAFIELKSRIAEVIFSIIGDTIQRFIDCWENVKQVIEGVLGFIYNLFLSFKALFTGEWDLTWEYFKTALSCAWDTIVALIEGFLNTLNLLFLGLIEKALVWGSDLLGKFGSGISSMISSVVGWIINLGSQIGTAFGNIISNAYNWGKNMISGFIDGIKSMVSSVVSTVSNVMSNVKDFLGFNSPSKKGEGRFITRWGENMVSGFIDGIDNARPNLTEKMNSLIRLPKSSFDIETNVIRRLSDYNVGAYKPTAVVENVITLDGRTLTRELSPRFDVEQGSTVKLNARRVGIK